MQLARDLFVGALVFAPLAVDATPTLVPNGDFETPDGATWTEVSGGGTYAFQYPTTEGNPGGFGVIDNSAGDGGFGIWVANGNAPLTLASLGMTAGESYRFLQDMKILSGSTLGGFKVDFFTGPDLTGSTDDIFPDLIGSGNTWETYTFEVRIPENADGIKLVPLWGAGSVIGYDNVCIDTSPVVVPPPPPIPNGDFEEGNTGWFEQGAPETTFAYPETGGNPDGHGIMTNTGSGSGNWVANGGAPVALAPLGLEGGDTVNFLQDMRLFSGPNIGGLRVEFLEGATFLGATPNMYPQLIGDGGTWETYRFEVAIPETADNIKVFPLYGLGSSVGFDNLTMELLLPVPLALDFEVGTAVTWEAPSESNLYQPQRSSDGEAWEDLGPVVMGNEVTSVFDSSEAPFYRVLETPVAVTNVAVNGGFENSDGEETLAQGWRPIGSQPPVRTTADMRTGMASMRLRVQNDDTPTPNGSEIQQNIAEAGGSIVAGESYDLSFWAKQITSGVSYVQQYSFQWLDGNGAILPGGIAFTPFSGGTGDWEEIAATGLVAPDGAQTALVQILGNTGAVPGANAQGEVLIDDFSLTTATTGPAVDEAVLNGDFEILDPLDPFCSEFWVCGGTQTPTNVVPLDGAFDGIAAMELRVQNDFTPTPNSSELSHDIAAAGGMITPGTSYDFSFQAKSISSGASFVQQYSLEWRNGAGQPLAGGIEVTNFSPGPDWTEVRVEGLLAPDEAATAVIRIVAATGAVGNPAAEGTVLIDAVSLGAAITPEILPASPEPGVQLSWGTEEGNTYQVQRSLDLQEFSDFGPPIIGDGRMWSAVDTRTDTQQFYQVVETAP